MVLHISLSKGRVNKMDNNKRKEMDFYFAPDIVKINKPLSELEIPEGTKYIYSDFYIGEILPNYERDLSTTYIMKKGHVCSKYFPETVYKALKKLIENEDILIDALTYVYNQNNLALTVRDNSIFTMYPADTMNEVQVIKEGVLIYKELDIRTCMDILGFIDDECSYDCCSSYESSTFALLEDINFNKESFQGVLKEISYILKNLALANGFGYNEKTDTNIVLITKNDTNLKIPENTNHLFTEEGNYLGKSLNYENETTVVLDGVLLNYNLDKDTYLNIIKLCDERYYNKFILNDYNYGESIYKGMRNSSLLYNVSSCIQKLENSKQKSCDFGEITKQEYYVYRKMQEGFKNNLIEKIKSNKSKVIKEDVRRDEVNIQQPTKDCDIQKVLVLIDTLLKDKITLDIDDKDKLLSYITMLEENSKIQKYENKYLDKIEMEIKILKEALDKNVQNISPIRLMLIRDTVNKIRIYLNRIVKERN